MRSVMILVTLIASVATPRPQPGMQAAQNAPARDASTPPTGTGTIGGRVTGGGDGVPLPRAMVSIATEMGAHADAESGCTGEAQTSSDVVR
jgi:hypothetical protein